MKEITVLSGKGGAGKTTITGSLTTILKSSIIADCDVDAADLFLLLNPKINQTFSFSSGIKAKINNSLCINCRKCINNCRFDSFYHDTDNNLIVNETKCEGCGLCRTICPVNAITLTEEYNNKWFISETRNGTMVHAQMKPGEENSGQLVSQLRKKTKELANTQNANFIINDGPPGVGCAAIASVTGTDIVVLVIEASKSGVHDFKRALEMVNNFNTKKIALINKYDINIELTNEIEKELKKLNIPLGAKIPFDKIITKSTYQGKTVPEYSPDSEITKQLKNLAKLIKRV